RAALTRHAQLVHCRRHPGKALDASLHPLQDFDLIVVDGAELLLEQEAAVSLCRCQRRPEIVQGARQEIRAVLIVFLQLQTRVEQALQQLLPVACDTISRTQNMLPRARLRTANSVLQEGLKSSRIDRLQKDAAGSRG